MDPLQTFLCALNRQRKVRELLGRAPILWRIDGPINRALDAARIEVLERMPKGGLCAELGVWKGDFSSEILRVTKPRLLHLVDPWETAPELYTEVHARFQFVPNVQIRRTTSIAFLESCHPASLDWIYLDADHREEPVAADLEACWPVLKSGGWLVGDDYFWRDPSGIRTVKATVDRFCRSSHLPYELIGGQFLIQKP